MKPAETQRTEIAAIPKGNRAEIRVAMQIHNGATVIDVRVWYRPKKAADDVPMQPTFRGITMAPERAASLAEALSKAAKAYI